VGNPRSRAETTLCQIGKKKREGRVNGVVTVEPGLEVGRKKEGEIE